MAQTAAAAAASSRADVADARLRRVIERTLQSNRDLRIAALNIERARALYGIQQAAEQPAIGAAGSALRQRIGADTSSSGQARSTTTLSAQLALASYEIDFFGRVRNLSEAALQSFLATESSRRATQIALVADTANAWLALAADTQRLELARQTLKAREDAYALTRRAYELGGQSGLTLLQSQTAVDTARADVGAFEAQRRLSRNALELLAGGPLPPDALPDGGETVATALIEVPAGLPSEVLAQRPDVIAAEHQLRGAQASIGAARAAFFPRISLTAAAGLASTSLSGLFDGGAAGWSFAPSISLPIFDGGSARANLRAAEVQRDIQIAGYEKTLQTAFREVADALAQRSTLGERLAAQQSLVEASRRSLALSQARFRSGADSYLEVLDAQRSLYAAQQALISLRQLEQVNRLVLYKALGGGWQPADREG
ncbi:efflux transporter outer membrane subunit [Piscinibacter sakaiensis]|uniref:efflux transporter outer membrane subunit n=1 Tax=Piscinibacter sakaiensis TaxID=1547922 RepID=UPI003726EFE0